MCSFLLQITSLGESCKEEFRRKLYECLYQCYDFAFTKKDLNSQVPVEIINSIKTISDSFIPEKMITSKYI